MKDAKTPRVMVLDGDQPAALAVVRSLGRKGLAVDVGERSARCLSSWSRHCADSFVYPDPLHDAVGFVRAIRERAQAGAYEMIVPVSDDTVHPLAGARSEFERLTRLAIAPDEALEAMFDKARTLSIAEKLGVPVPRTQRFTGLTELEAAAPTFTYPVVVKPARSIADHAEDSRQKRVVLYASDAGALVAIARLALRGGALLIQEYCVGVGVGVEVLCDHGEVVSIFQHEREHEMPLSGGGSCLRKSVPVDPQLAAWAGEIMRAVSWHGVAMVEFKVEPSRRRAFLMEVNGRFWGSLPLAVAAGADFPGELHDLVVHGRRPALNRPPARTGVVCRKLSFDVFWFIEVMRRADPSPFIQWPTRSRAFFDVLRVLSPRHRFDVQSIVDPVPGLVDVVLIWRALWRRVADRFEKAAIRRRQEAGRRGAKVVERLRRAKRVLVLCHGNINRSAVADGQARRLIGADTALDVASAGFHPRAGRSADPVMSRIAARRGLALEGFKSKTVDAAAIAAADVIFTMEVEHVQRLAAEFGESGGKVWLLGTLVQDPQWPLEIADPYGRDDAAYARCFDHVTACMEAMAETVADAPRRSGART